MLGKNQFIITLCCLILGFTSGCELFSGGKAAQPSASQFNPVELAEDLGSYEPYTVLPANKDEALTAVIITLGGMVQGMVEAAGHDPQSWDFIQTSQPDVGESGTFSLYGNASLPVNFADFNPDAEGTMQCSFLIDLSATGSRVESGPLDLDGQGIANADVVCTAITDGEHIYIPNGLCRLRSDVNINFTMSYANGNLTGIEGDYDINCELVFAIAVTTDSAEGSIPYGGKFIFRIKLNDAATLALSEQDLASQEALLNFFLTWADGIGENCSISLWVLNNDNQIVGTYSFTPAEIIALLASVITQ